MKSWMKSIFLILLIPLLSGQTGRIVTDSDFEVELEKHKDKLQNIRVITENQIPYNFMYQGVPFGISTEIVQAVLEQLHISPKIEFMTWQTAYPLARSTPGVLLFTVTKIPQREDHFHWIGPLYPSVVGFWKLRENNIAIDSLSSLKDLKVGSIPEFAETELMRSKGYSWPQYQAPPDVENKIFWTINRLFSGELDLVIMEKHILEYNSMYLGYDWNRIQMIDNVDRFWLDLYMVFGKQTDPDVVHLFQSAYDQVLKNGTFDDIINKY